VGKDSFGFALRAAGLIRTLSPNNPRNYDAIQGLLYSPVLPASSPCSNDTLSLIPSNVTTRADFLPDQDYPLVALAPWTDSACVQSYLSVIRTDQVRGAIFFHPDNSSALPPPVSDTSWSLQDGGQWKSANDFPVYAIPGMLGTFLLNELALYSGNMSEVPFGEELVTIYNPHDSVKLYARMTVSSTGGIPSLWVFLIIVLAILLAVVLMTSAVMHLIQRRQRVNLQRRVANGEVDLESLGIKRMQVPQEILDRMPQYVFTTKASPDSAKTDIAVDAEDSEAVSAAKEAATMVTAPATKDVEQAIGPAAAAHEVAFSQSTCPICLDDFANMQTMVRELPCNHVFHPECIDPFLRDTSSLCPVCKKSSLPAGYCPVQVTNLMVRRERLMRRVRENGGTMYVTTPAARLGGRVIRAISLQAPPPRIDPRISSERETIAGTEMQSVAPVRRQTMTEEDMPEDIRAQGVSARRAWLRERLARRQARDYEQRADEGRVAEESRPLCKSRAAFQTNILLTFRDRAPCRRQTLPQPLTVQFFVFWWTLGFAFA
jgi:hypothetical protein